MSWLACGATFWAVFQHGPVLDGEEPSAGGPQMLNYYLTA